MKKKTIIILGILIVVIGLSIGAIYKFSYDSKSENNNDEDYATVESEPLVIPTGKSENLLDYYKVGSNISAFTVISYDPTIIQVDANGIVTAISEGTTKISFSIGDKKYEEEITVSEAQTSNAAVSTTVKLGKAVYSSKTGRALQSSTGVNGNIYFSTSVSGKGPHKDNESRIRVQNSGEANDFTPILKAHKYMKINGATTAENRTFFVAYDPRTSMRTGNTYSKVYFSYQGKVKYFNLNFGKSKIGKKAKVSNIAYNSYDGNFYSSNGGKKKNNVYKYKLNIDHESKSQVKKQDSCYFTKNSSIVDKYGDNNIASQDITIINNNLYFAYTTYTNKDYNSFVDVFDLSECTKGKKLTRIKTLKLGSCSSSPDSCELESLFYMNGKMYFGFNDSTFKTANFYAVNYNDIK